MRRKNKHRDKRLAEYLTVKTALTQEKLQQAQACAYFSIFLVKTEHEARTRNVFELCCYQQIKELVLGSSSSYQDGEDRKKVRKNGATVPCYSIYDNGSFPLNKELPLALICALAFASLLKTRP